jgi:hypothetical protein
MAEDFECGSRFAKAFFSGGKQNVLMLGNHDVRAWDLAESTDAVQAGLGHRMVADIKALAKKHKAKLIPYDSRDGIYRIGHLNVIHGFHAGVSACAAHSRIYGNVVFGHIHSIESYQTPGVKQQEARSIGCLCKLDMDYINRKTAKLRWAHGFAYGWLFPDGTYQIHQARMIDGKFHCSTSIQGF